jgi:hypothetical protein
MKNITAQYRDLQEGKITKANFMANVRMQFPDYISPVNSYEDMVKILKSKRILSEIEDMNKTSAQLDAEGAKKAFYLVDETGDVIDSIMAVDSQEASDYFENEYDGIGSSLTVIHTSNPDDLRGGVAEDTDKKDIEALRAGALHEDDMEDPYKEGYQGNEDGYHLKDCPYESGTTEAELWKDGWLDYETEKQIEHDEETYDRETGGYGDLYRETLNEAIDAGLATVVDELGDGDREELLKMLIAKIKSSKPSFIQKLKNALSSTTATSTGDIDTARPYGVDTQAMQGVFERNYINEAAEKAEGSYKEVTGKDLYSFFNEIDRLNPYEVKKGIDIEMGMQYKPTPNYFTDDFNPESLAKATRKVLKNLQKDPAYYTNMISLPTEKRTNMYQKPTESKTKADGYTKIKGLTDAKSNTETNLVKKERAKGSPEGVKEMKPSKRSMGGLKTMKSNDRLPKGVELMKESTEEYSFIGRFKGTQAEDLRKSLPKDKAIDIEVEAEDGQKYTTYVRSKVYTEKQLEDAVREVGAIMETARPLTKEALENLIRKQLKESMDIGVDKKAKLKELVMQEVKKRLGKNIPGMVKEKISSEDLTKAATTGDTLNIPSSDSQAIAAAKSKKVSYTTYE